MGWTYEISEIVAEEIDDAIRHYETEFSSGAADFLSAYDPLQVYLICLKPGRAVQNMILMSEGKDWKFQKVPKLMPGNSLTC